jgi:dienelactone hydrolase
MPSTSLAKAAVVTAVLAALAACHSMAPRAGAVSTDVPAAPERAGRHVIYVHDVALDRAPDDAERRARLARVIQALAARGTNVIAEVRPAGTIQKVPEDLDRYARRVAGQVWQLLAAGVPASRVTVMGYSRGAVLALLSSTHVADARVGYVAIAGCMNETGAFKAFVPVMLRYAEKFSGEFLAVNERSDPDFASCAPYFARSTAAHSLAERSVVTGKGHNFAAEPDAAWVEPVTAWIMARP